MPEDESRPTQPDEDELEETDAQPDEVSSSSTDAGEEDVQQTDAQLDEDSSSPAGAGGDDVSTLGAWLAIGCVGSVLLISGAAFIGGIAYLILSAEDETDPEPTPIIASDPTPGPTPTETATEELDPTATPDPSLARSFGPGTHEVGVDIQPGIYFANDAGDFCYWERVSDFTGEREDIISNQIIDNRAIVEILESDAGFVSERCGDWDKDAPLVRDDPSADFESGQFLVTDEITPGIWQSQGAGDSCYWARLSGFTSDLDDIITNGFGEEDPTVEISPDDRGFESSECGTWTLIEGQALQSE